MRSKDEGGPMIRMRPDAPVAFTILNSMPLRQILLYAADLPGTWTLLPLDPTPHRERELVAMVMDGIGEGLRVLG